MAQPEGGDGLPPPLLVLSWPKVARVGKNGLCWSKYSLSWSKNDLSYLKKKAWVGKKKTELVKE